MTGQRMLIGWVICVLAVGNLVEAGSKSSADEKDGIKGAASQPIEDALNLEANTASEVEYVDGPLAPLYDFLNQRRLFKFCKLLREAALDQAILDLGGSWTLFAPTDASFFFLPQGALEVLKKDPQRLREFILYHFVVGDFPSDQIQNEMLVDSVQGAPLRFNIYGQTTTVSGAQILEPDVPFELGRVHIIDRPLHPVPTADIINFLQSNYREFYRLIVSVNLVDYLSGGGVFTLLVPDDAAFDALSPELRKAIRTNASLAERIVLNHILPGSVYTGGVTDGLQWENVGGGVTTFTTRRGLVFANDIPLVYPDQNLLNGVVHVINKVILPEGIEADCKCKPSLESEQKVDSRNQANTRPPFGQTHRVQSGQRPSQRPTIPPTLSDQSRPAGLPNRPGVPASQPANRPWSPTRTGQTVPPIGQPSRSPLSPEEGTTQPDDDVNAVFGTTPTNRWDNRQRTQAPRYPTPQRGTFQRPTTPRPLTTRGYQWNDLTSTLEQPGFESLSPEQKPEAVPPTQRPQVQANSWQQRKQATTRQPFQRPTFRTSRPTPPSQRRPITTRTPAAPPAGQSQQTACRSPQERITSVNRHLPVCPGPLPADCQNPPYDQADPRPPCTEPSAPTDQGCRQPGEPIFAGDRRPLCLVPTAPQGGCRDPTAPFNPSDRRPPCRTGVPTTDVSAPEGCRRPEEVADPQDPRPLCPQEDCRSFLERPKPGDRRPICKTHKTTPQGGNAVEDVKPGRPQQQPTAPPRRQSWQSTQRNQQSWQSTTGAPQAWQSTTRAQQSWQSTRSQQRWQSTTRAQQSWQPSTKEPQDWQPSSSPPQGSQTTRATQSWQNTRTPQTWRTTRAPQRWQTTSTPQTHGKQPQDSFQPEVGPQAPPGSQNQNQDHSGQSPEQPQTGSFGPHSQTGRHPSPQQPGRQPSQPHLGSQPSPPSQPQPSPPSSPHSGTHPSHQRPGAPQSGRQPFQPGPPVRQPSPGGSRNPQPGSPVPQPGQFQPGRVTPVYPQRQPGLPQNQPRFTTTVRPTGGVTFPVSDSVQPSAPQGPGHQSGSFTPAPRRPITTARVPVSVTGTSATTGEDTRRSLYEIVEDPALLIRGRPVKLTKVFELFHKAGLEDTLLSPGPTTMFLPSDDAFSALPRGVVEQLEENPDLLRRVLSYHVTATEVLPSPQTESFSVPSMEGTRIPITMNNGGRLILISGAKAVAVTRASNGIFYVINKLLYPLPSTDIVGAVQSRPDLSTLAWMLSQSGLNELLQGENPHTLLAPTDNAFAQLSPAAYDELTQNTTAMREVLLNHVIDGAHYGREFLTGGTFPSARGGKLKFQVQSYGYQVNDVNIKTPEIVTGTGIIHLIDQVLLEDSDQRLLKNTVTDEDSTLSNNQQLGAAGPHQGPNHLGPRTPVQPSPGSRLPSGQPQLGGLQSSLVRPPPVGRIPNQGLRVPGSQRTQSQAENSSPFANNRLQPNHGQQSPGHQVPGSFGNRHQPIDASGQSQGGSNLCPGCNQLTTQPVHLQPGRSPTGGQRGHTQNQNPQLGALGNQGRPGAHAGGHQAVGNPNGGQPNDVADLARSMGLNKFANWISNTGLLEKIHDGGVYTVFAPTDDAVNSLPQDMVQSIESNPEQVKSLLQYHIIPQRVNLNSVTNEETTSTLLSGKPIRFNVYQNSQPDCKQIVTASGTPVGEALATTGSVQVIPVAQVLYQPSGNLLKIIQSSPILQQLNEAVKSARISWVLSGTGPVTIFAPSDNAFASLSEEERKNLIENQQAFSDLLKRHIVRGTLFSTGVQEDVEKKSENNKPIRLSLQEGVLTVNSVPVTFADITATNGVLHVIDQFL